MPSPKETSVPTERVEARATTSLMGNWRCDQNVEHFPADIAGRADHRDFVSHGHPPVRRAIQLAA